MITIQKSQLSPEEHAAIHGDRADHRVQVWRQTYGPGERRTGARFRDEVRVCTSCAAVAIERRLPGCSICFGKTGRKVPRRDAMSADALERWGRRMSAAKLDQLVDQPCPGIMIHPVAELGYRWLDGQRLKVSA